MNRNEAITLIEEYNRFLLKEGYVDTDIWCEEPKVIDRFLLSKWGKENLPLKDEERKYIG